MFVRDLEAQNRLETFLITAIVSILGIRLYLHLLNYPQIGGAGLHIAHMLWGGLFMLIALFIMLSTVNRRAETVAAFLGGIGFGTFIDELGKFITSDNNYFFQPTIAILYVIFVMLYLTIRFVSRNTNVSDRLRLANALDLLKEGIIHQITPQEKKSIDAYIKQNKQHAVSRGMEVLLKEVYTTPSGKYIFDVLYDNMQAFYRHIAGRKVFRRIIIFLFIAQAGITLIQAFLLTEALHHYLTAGTFHASSDLSFAEMGDLIFSVISGVFIIAGIVALLRKALLRGYQLFKIAVLISIFLTQFFTFYDIQFGALYGFAFNIFILYTLRSMIEWEQTQKLATRK